MASPAGSLSSSSKWTALIDRRREEIARDTQELTQAKARRARALYNASGSDALSTTSSDATGPLTIVDGRLDLTRHGLDSCVLPMSLDAGQLRTIETLVLRGNRIRAIEAHVLAPLSSLLLLDVAENDLERLCPVTPATYDDWPPRLRILLASRNRIARLTLGGSRTLLKLDVSRNHLRFLGPHLDKLPQLRQLDARHNHLDDIHPAVLKHLASLRHLRCLLLAGNPLVRDPRHRLKLFAAAPQLRNALNAPRVLIDLDDWKHSRRGAPEDDRDDGLGESLQTPRSRRRRNFEF